MPRTAWIAAVLAVAAAGCETEGQDLLGRLIGRKVTIDLLEARPPTADEEETLNWQAVVRGVRPNNETVGYLETRAWTPAGGREAILIRYFWPMDLSAPVGFVTENGTAYRYTLPELRDGNLLAPTPSSVKVGGGAPERLGRLPIEAAALFLLRVRAADGTVIEPEVVDAQARVDLGARFAPDYHRLIGPTGRVAFEDLSAADVMPKPAPVAAAAAPAPAPADAPTDNG